LEAKDRLKSIEKQCNFSKISAKGEEIQKIIKKYSYIYDGALRYKGIVKNDESP
jgi:hypothetical protein